LLLVVLVQPRRRRGLGRRACRLGRRRRLALGRLLAFLLVLLLFLLLRLGRRRGLRRSDVGGLRLLTLGGRPGVSLAGLRRVLLFRVRHGLFRLHARNRLAGLDRDPLRRSIFVQAPPHPGRLARLGVEQHHFRRRERGGQLDNAALLVRRGGALVLLHDVHALHHHPELLGVHVQHFALFPPMLARDHPHRVAFGDVQLVALGLPRPGAAAALLEDERLHVRSPRARATRFS